MSISSGRYAKKWNTVKSRDLECTETKWENDSTGLLTYEGLDSMISIYEYEKVIRLMGWFIVFYKFKIIA